LLWIHGGGMVAGDPAMDDQMLGQVVSKLGVVVASVHYRRAPEHPYPMPLNDCLGGWQWLQHNADRLGVDRARIGIGGESAGGGLAATLVHRLHDESPGRVRAQWLMCPMLDDRTAARTDISGRAHRIWNNRNNRFGWHSYLGVEPGSERVPDGAVPARRTNLRGLPPTWIGIAGLDLFAVENLAYAHRLREAGVAVETDVVDGAYHGFQTVAAGTKLVEDYLGRATNWLGQALGAESNVCF
jgi:acetyl esterase/lipase